MRRQPSLRSQLNQIRMWVRQGRTDAWIAHKLDVSVDDLARFKREHTLDDGDGGTQTRARPADPLSVPAPEPRAELDEIEEEEEGEEEEDEVGAEERVRERPRPRRRSRRSRPRRLPVDEDDDEELAAAPEADETEQPEDDLDRGEADSAEPDGAPRRRRRGRRGGRRHRARRSAYEATFDHGGEGYGLWLDPSVADNPVYSEHWAGHRAVTVTVEADAITIRRAAADREPDPEAVSGEPDE